jgi:hypothetical protein
LSSCDPSSQFWDSLHSNCYNVTCGFLFENVAGGCVARNITQDQLNANLVRSDKCYMVTLHPWEMRRVS